MEEEAGISVEVALSHLSHWMKEMVKESQLPTKIDNEGEPLSKMLKIEKTSSEEVKNIHKKRVEAAVQCSQALKHAAYCHDKHCKQRGCLQFKIILVHKNECNIECCYFCSSLLIFSIVHSKKCSLARCPVPFCSELKYRRSYNTLLKLQRDYDQYLKGSSPDCISESNLPPDSYVQKDILSMSETELMFTIIRRELSFECKAEPSSVTRAKGKMDMIKGILRQLLFVKIFARKREERERIDEQIAIIIVDNPSLFPEFQDWIFNTKASLAMREGG